MVCLLLSVKGRPPSQCPLKGRKLSRNPRPMPVNCEKLRPISLGTAQRAKTEPRGAKHMHLFALLAAADGFNEDRMRLLVGIFSCEFIECCHAFLNAHHRPGLQSD